MDIPDTDPTAFDIDFDPRHQRMRGTAIHGNTPFDVPFISHVTGNLWQGGCQYGLVLPPNIKHVVSLYPWEAYYIKHDATYTPYVMYDSDEVQEEDVRSAAELVNERVEDGPTLVHCQAGLNRSGLVAAYSLMLKGMSALNAITLLRESRSPAVLCNRTFEAWLMDRWLDMDSQV